MKAPKRKGYADGVTSGIGSGFIPLPASPSPYLRRLPSNNSLPRIITMTQSHNERCRDCKKSVGNLLAATFGDVKVNWDLELPCRMADYKNTKMNDVLVRVYDALKRYRGYKDFVRAKKLSRADFFIPSQSLIIEFDEFSILQNQEILRSVTTPITAVLVSR